MAKNDTKNSGHIAVARALDLQVSTKHCIEICRSLRYKKTSFAKKFLGDVAELKRPVSFKKFNQDLGHKAGMSSGRYPVNAAKEILKLISSVEANAQVKGLNTSNLKIIKILANKAAIPITGGRHRTGTKRTHVEVEVKEGKGLREAMNVKKVEAPKPEVKKEEQVKKVPVQAEKPVEDTVKDAKVPVQKIAKLSTRVEEPSPAELLRKAQEKAEELNRKEKEAESTKEVSDLYKELQKKGSLRHKRDAL